MRPHFPAPAALALAALLPWGALQAARPMVTDDARIVDAQACQVESWVKRNPDSTEYWAQPACNFTGNLELSLGAAKGKDDHGTRTTDVVLQAKTLFKPLEPDGWGWGLAVGHVRHPANGARGDLYAYLPASVALQGERLVLHANVGWLHEREARRHRMTWGLGTEAQWSASSWLIAEVFGQHQGTPFYQVGIRHWLVPGHVQVDTTYGNRAGSGTQERWLSIGLRLLSPAFLP